MSEENKAKFRRVVEDGFGQGKLDVIDELIDPNWVDHNPMPGQEPGPEGMKKLLTMFRNAFPDMTLTLDVLMAEGDLVAGRNTMSGTHTGELMGIPPTNKRITMTEIHIVRIANGKAVEHWGNSDDMGMMMQLGVIPEPGG